MWLGDVLVICTNHYLTETGMRFVGGTVCGGDCLGSCACGGAVWGGCVGSCGGSCEGSCAGTVYVGTVFHSCLVPLIQ